MNVDEALRAFAEADDLPREAMSWALANWEAAAPRFVARLRAVAAGADPTDAAVDQVFYILHLCGQMRETRAYEPLCRWIARDPDLEVALGDAITETLPDILISVFDGDCEPLIAAIRSREADGEARGAALLALGYLVRSRGALDDDAMRALLEHLRQEAASEADQTMAQQWADAAAALGYDDLKMEVALLAKEGLIDPRYLSLVDFEEIVQIARSDPAGLAAFHDQQVQPLDDAIGAMETWSFGEHDEFELDETEDLSGDNPFDGPYVNPLRDVGRNDPCPCGSGKKYKKCCLAA
ncbi:MAG TPA: DUF1186 domain-containing protein [Roseiarcus sp.]|nr:DUF1186 domain-containing protein [Roseiarcus sp.]